MSWYGLDSLTGEEMNDAAAIGQYIMLYPADYTPTHKLHDNQYRKIGRHGIAMGWNAINEFTSTLTTRLEGVRNQYRRP